ncbi:MAG: hypothetical protein ABR915_22775 [Thermoguttaceae bacterium]
MQVHVVLRIGLLAVAAAVVAAGGCWDSPPPRVLPRAIAPDAAQKALELYDANHDGFLDAQELEKVPGLKAAMKRADLNHDGKLSAEEIKARIESWQSGGVGRMSVPCTVTYNGEPLAGAQVTLEPESFLGGDLKAGTGTTNASGQAMIAAAPSGANDAPGMSPGFYRVRITKSGQAIPARYNTETTLGLEVAADAEEMETAVVFDLHD